MPIAFHHLLRILMFLFFITTPTIDAAGTNPLPAHQAFQLTGVTVDQHHNIVTEWNVQPGYYLYHDLFEFKVLNAPSVLLGVAAFPNTSINKMYPDGKKMRVYTGRFKILLPLTFTATPPSAITLNINYQGCSEIGICYPRLENTVDLALQTSILDPSYAPSMPPLHEKKDYLTTVLQGGHLIMIITVFFGIGILLSLTPCVLPMIPILSSIIMGQKQLTHSRSLGLAIAYVLGMAITYAILGLFVGLLGSHVQVALQRPWVLTLFSLLMVTMALSLFGYFHLQVPAFLRDRVSTIQQHQQRGNYFSTFIMGVLSTLILSPCVTPALATAILYIADKGNATLGATALFSLGIGMGIPLLIVGAFGAKLLPKTGRWMNGVKIFLGFLMLAVAIWTMSRILPGLINMLLWAALGIIIAIVLRTFRSTTTIAQHIGKIFGILLFIFSIALIIGAFLGNTNPLQPIPFNLAKKMTPLHFHRITSLDEFKKQLKLAQAAHRPILLDFFADWCVECHQLDTYTLSDPEVQALLKRYVLIRADVTANSARNRALEKHYNVIAPPTMIFFDQNGKELEKYRIIGHITAKAMIQHLLNLSALYSPNESTAQYNDCKKSCRHLPRLCSYMLRYRQFQ